MAHYYQGGYPDYTSFGQAPNIDAAASMNYPGYDFGFQSFPAAPPDHRPFMSTTAPPAEQHGQWHLHTPYQDQHPYFNNQYSHYHNNYDPYQNYAAPHYQHGSQNYMHQAPPQANPPAPMNQVPSMSDPFDGSTANNYMGNQQRQAVEVRPNPFPQVPQPPVQSSLPPWASPGGTGSVGLANPSIDPSLAQQDGTTAYAYWQHQQHQVQPNLSQQIPEPSAQSSLPLWPLPGGNNLFPYTHPSMDPSLAHQVQQAEVSSYSALRLSELGIKGSPFAENQAPSPLPFVHQSPISDGAPTPPLITLSPTPSSAGSHHSTISYVSSPDVDMRDARDNQADMDDIDMDIDDEDDLSDYKVVQKLYETLRSVRGQFRDEVHAIQEEHKDIRKGVNDVLTEIRAIRATQQSDAHKDVLTSKHVFRMKELGPSRRLLMRIVRHFFRELMGITRTFRNRHPVWSWLPDPPTNPDRMPDEASPFVPNWHKLRCPWNFECSKIFTKRLCRHPQLAKLLPYAASSTMQPTRNAREMLDNITKAFWIRLSTLCERYKEEVKRRRNAEREEEELNGGAKRKRRDRILKTRKFRCPPGGQHLLSNETTSEDEASSLQVPLRPPLYRVIPSPWRSPRFTEFLRELDDFHRASRLGTKGMQPREREDDPSLRPTNFPIPFGLPSNCYCETFLANLRLNRPLMYRSLVADMAPPIDFDDLVAGILPDERDGGEELTAEE